MRLVKLNVDWPCGDCFIVTAASEVYSNLNILCAKEVVGVINYYY